MHRSWPLVSLLGASFLAACAAPTPESTDSSSHDLTQIESFRITQSADVLAALEAAGVTGPAAGPSWPDDHRYRAEVSCATSTSCAVVDKAPGLAATAVPLAGAVASSLVSALQLANVPADGALVIGKVTVSCEKNVYVNATTLDCSAERTVDKPAPNERAILTGTGARMKVGFLWRQDSLAHGGFDQVLTYELTYEDLTSYFGDAPSITATVVKTTHVAHHGGYPDAPQTSSSEVTLAKVGPKTYKAVFEVHRPGGDGDWQTMLDAISAAFHVGSKWDSNFGHNYDL